MSRQTLSIIVVILVFGGAGLWFFYFQSLPDESAATGQGIISSNPDVQRIEQELTDLRRLKDLQIDTSILKNPFLQALEPSRVPTQSIGATTTTTSGRTNPFLPF